MYKIILFDFDGTIANTIDIGIPLYNKLARKYNLLEIKNKYELRNFSIREFIKNHKISKLKILFHFNEFLKLLNKNIEKIKIYNNMDLVIKELNKKYKLGILSANSKENIKKILKNNNLDYCFDFIEDYSFLFGKSKAIKKIIKKYKIKKQDLIYIADDASDITETKKAGIDIISVVWGFNKKETLEKKKPRFIAEKPEDIILFLEKQKSYK